MNLLKEMKIIEPLPYHTYFIQMAEQAAERSHDPNTKVGAVLVGNNGQVISTGYNGFPRGVLEPKERWERPTKYSYVVHAEANAIYNAAYSGVSTANSMMYLNWEPLPCKECMNAVIQAGVLGIIGPPAKFPNTKKWGPDFKFSLDKLRESVVRSAIWDGETLTPYLNTLEEGDNNENKT